MAPHIPIQELNSAIESAIQKALGQHGGPTIDKLWVGFVAPENIATLEMAGKVAAQITHATGIQGTPSLAQIGGGAPAQAAGGAVHTDALIKPGHIMGLIYNPQLKR